MINNLLKLRNESRKSSSRLVVDPSENKDQILTNLTSEAFNEYKKKIQTLRKDNQNLLNELDATNRNFDVINKKYNESQNLIKRLNEELLKLKSKGGGAEGEGDLNMEDKIKSYTKKIDELYSENELLKKQLSESKTRLNRVDSELRRKKNDIAQVEQQNLKVEELKTENEKLNKENLFLQTKLKAFMAENQSNKKEMANLSKTALELNNEKQKLLNEKKLLENNLEQARQKLLDEINSKDEIIQKFKQKGNEDKELENKLKEIQSKYEQLQEELSIEKNNNVFNDMNNKNLLEEINKLKNNKKWNKVNKIKSYVAVVLIKGKTQIKNKVNKFSPQKLKIIKDVNKIQISSMSNKKNQRKFDTESFDLVGEIDINIINQNTNNLKDNKDKDNYNSKNMIQSSVNTVIITRDLTNIFKLKENIKNMVVNQLNIFVENNTNNFNTIENKIKDLENKVNKISTNINKFKEDIYDYLCLKFNSLKSENGLLIEKNEQCQREVDLFKRKYDYDMKQIKDEMEKKLEKKRNKKYNLKKTIEELKKTIEDMEKKKIDLSEIKKLFELVSNISKRLNLTFDNLQMAFKCKICNEVKDKMLCLPICGHSVCDKCLYQDKVNEESKTPQIHRCVECGNDIMDDNIPYNFSLNAFVARYNYAKQQVESDLEMMVKSIQAYISQ